MPENEKNRLGHSPIAAEASFFRQNSEQACLVERKGLATEITEFTETATKVNRGLASMPQEN
jgi:hypothetical protein